MIIGGFVWNIFQNGGFGPVPDEQYRKASQTSIATRGHLQRTAAPSRTKTPEEEIRRHRNGFVDSSSNWT